MVTCQSTKASAKRLAPGGRSGRQWGMPAQVLCVTFDCHDPGRLAEFWATALGYEVDHRAEAYGEVMVADPKGESVPLLFLKVPEGKSVKNRVHIDVTPETTLEAEVERLVDLGAASVETMQDPEDHPERWIWTVMKDPEDNEFCVGQPLSDRA
jgi:Glyoxalase-like domain